jgi:hypothetical protein
MSVLTVPRTIAGLQYKALRYPSQLLETRVVAAYLPDESGVRLAFERVLGTLDATAGSLFADEALQHRGEALRRRALKVEKVVALEEKAAARRTEAEQKLAQEKQAAEQEKARVQQQHEAEAARLKAERDAEKQAIARKAAERQKADETAIRSQTEAILSAERDRIDAQEAKIEARVATSTAQPKQQLQQASKTAKAAKQKAQDAETLSALAKAEKSSR